MLIEINFFLFETYQPLTNHDLEVKIQHLNVLEPK